MKYHMIRTICTLIVNKDNTEWKQISKACKQMLLSSDCRTLCDVQNFNCICLIVLFDVIVSHFECLLVKHVL